MSRSASGHDISWSKAESNGALARPLVLQANVLRCFGPKGACRRRSPAGVKLASLWRQRRSGIRKTRLILVSGSASGQGFPSFENPCRLARSLQAKVLGCFKPGGCPAEQGARVRRDPEKARKAHKSLALPCKLVPNPFNPS